MIDEWGVRVENAKTHEVNAQRRSSELGPVAPRCFVRQVHRTKTNHDQFIL